MPPGLPHPPAGAPPALSPDELLRYGRHLLLPEVGLEGQRRLRAASVLVIGAGGLGSPLALYLAAAGVGRLGLVDFDAVDPSNLQRQILHGTAAVGTSKLASARARLADLNPGVTLELHETQLAADNALGLLARYDVVADGSDNFPTRYLVNDACALLGRPLVYGSIYRFEGQVSVFDARVGPCYRCLYPEPPPPEMAPSCAEGGVLGVLPGVVGSVQASEALKLLLGIGEPLVGRLWLFDALEARARELALRRDPGCPLCGERRTITELQDYEAFCGLGPAGEDGVRGRDIGPRELRERLDRGDDLLLVDVREPHEWAIARLDGSTLVPMGALPQRLNDLDPAREIVLVCHHGNRSMHALRFLERMGFKRLLNLRGGIDAWSREVDPATPRY